MIDMMPLLLALAAAQSGLEQLSHSVGRVPASAGIADCHVRYSDRRPHFENAVQSRPIEQVEPRFRRFRETFYFDSWEQDGADPIVDIAQADGETVRNRLLFSGVTRSPEDDRLVLDMYFMNTQRYTVIFDPAKPDEAEYSSRDRGPARDWDASGTGHCRMILNETPIPITERSE